MHAYISTNDNEILLGAAHILDCCGCCVSRVSELSSDLHFEEGSYFCLSAKEILANGGEAAFIHNAKSFKPRKIIIVDEDASFFAVDRSLGGRLVNVSLPKCEVSAEISASLVADMILQEHTVYSCGSFKSANTVSLVKRVASKEVTLLINGPTGTGKEVLSRYVHANSVRKENGFVAVNCAAIPENMLEAMLFGHEKGAFTGASAANQGIFRAANNGTLLLDEISEMPLNLQAKILRVLQERVITPLGGSKEISVDVRVIATTNRDMLREIRAGKFREDLFYRLNVFPISTLGLSERTEDIIPIAMALLRKHSVHENMDFILSNCAAEKLKAHSWPGNVRELENVIQRALVLTDGPIIDADSIFLQIAEITNPEVSTEEFLLSKVS